MLRDGGYSTVRDGLGLAIFILHPSAFGIWNLRFSAFGIWNLEFALQRPLLFLISCFNIEYFNFVIVSDLLFLY